MNKFDLTLGENCLGLNTIFDSPASRESEENEPVIPFLLGGG